MTRRLLLTLSCLLSLQFSALQAEDSVHLHRIRVDSYGQVEKLYFKYRSLEIQTDAEGHFLALYVLDSSIQRLQPRIHGDHRFESINGIEVLYKYIDSGEIWFVGDLEIRFDPFYPGIIESLGPVEFSYHYVGDTPGLIRSLGDIDFRYRYPDNRIEQIGGMIFHYYLSYGEILERTEGMIAPASAVSLYISTGLPAVLGRSPGDSLLSE